MTDHASRPKDRWIDVTSNRWLIVAIVLVGCLIATGVGMAIASVFTDSREGISLSAYVPHEGEETGGLSNAGFIGMHDNTSALCAGISGCIEGYESDEAKFYRFDSQEHAHDYAATLSDGHQSAWIDIDFTGTSLTPTQILDTTTAFDSIGTSD